MASWRAAMTACLARSVNRENLTGSGGKAPESRSPQSEALGTNRFCAACLVTPMDWPISVHDAPVLRAWSTKWPIRWSASSPRCSEIRTAADTWSSALSSVLLM